jgi:very-short-patch-repair endonuclease
MACMPEGRRRHGAYFVDVLINLAQLGIEVDSERHLTPACMAYDRDASSISLG